MLHLQLIVHLLPLPKFSYLALLLGLMSPIVLQKGLKDELQATLSIFETPAEPSSDVNVIVIIIMLLLIIIDYRELKKGSKIWVLFFIRVSIIRNRCLLTSLGEKIVSESLIFVADVVKHYSRGEARDHVAELAMPVEHSEYFELSIRHYEEVVLILLLGEVELLVERLEPTALLALELYILLEKDPPVVPSIHEML